MELHAAHKVLGIPLALDLHVIHDLEKMGGVKLIRPSDYLRSCMLRAAAKTVSGFRAQHGRLVRVAMDGAPLARVGRGKCIPEGWDADAFCSNLRQASLGCGLGRDADANKIA